ncbi:MAG: nitroreductase family protein [Candidatus Marinimicrobia bacterium]|nr:nitroreductase family protein [Candidatus Neomarinimicrobiota bacterium]
MLRDLILKNRSYRRFRETEAISRRLLEEWVDLGRLSASGANKQPLKYALSADPQTNALIFPHLAWAGYLKDWGGPAPGERPAAYIVLVNDTEVASSCGCDHGIAAQSILLGAVEQGFGGCMIGSFSRAGIRQALKLDERYVPLLVLALGKPAERVQLEPVGPDGSIEYYRDAQDVHHVPKRALPDVICH